MRTTSTASGRSGNAVPGRRDQRPVPRRRPDAPHRRPAPRTGGVWRGPLAPAAWPSLTGRQRLTYLAVLLAGTIWLMVPRLYGAFTAHVHKEDGEIFLHGSLTGASLLERYTGYLHVVPRLISNACAQGPAEAYPVCVASASASLRLLLALLVIVVVTPCTRAWWAPLACGALALFGGVGQQEVLGNLTNLRWFLVVGATFALLGALRRPGHVLLGVLFVTGAALTDPLAFALAPVALWRLAALSGRQRLVPAAMLLALMLHGALIDTTARSSSLLDSLRDDPTGLAGTVVVRGPAEAALGESVSQALTNLLGTGVFSVLVLVGYALVLLVLLPGAPAQTRWLVALLLAAGTAFLAATVNFADLSTILPSQGLANASRYALIPSLTIGPALVLLVDRAGPGRLARAVSGGLVLVMALGCVADSRGDEWATHGPSWPDTLTQARRTCQEEGVTTVTVPLTPQGVPTPWTAVLTCQWVQGHQDAAGSAAPDPGQYPTHP